MCQVYHKLAIYLTTIENPRTQSEYEDSYTFKIFVFEFMNYYSSLIYIAFFKGRFYDYPGDTGARKNEFFKLKGGERLARWRKIEVKMWNIFLIS